MKIQLLSLRFWALFTSGHNSVGTGDWEYRLRSRIVSRHSPPPWRVLLGVGGGVVVIRFCPAHPPGLRGGGRLEAGRRSVAVL